MREAAFAAPAAMAQQGDLDVSIRPVENGVEFTLINTGQKSMSVLRWETPLESELTGDVFVVTPTDGGNRDLHARPATFSGRLFKRAAPQPSDFINIAAGETITKFVPLADYYQLKSDGGHHVSFSGVFQFEPLNDNFSTLNRDRSLLSHQFHSHDNLDAVYMKTGAVSVDLTATPEVLYAQAAGYSGCTASQLAELQLDFEESETITRQARQALENLPENERAGSPRYLKWFGTYDSNRYASVLNTYRQSETLMSASAVEFVCDCEEPYFAFIRRTEPFKVNLCTFYWSAQRTGSDSRAGTILHEVSHFNEIGGTADHAYGAYDVSNLALDNPVRAVNNADSIEYFAENTPALDISAGVVGVQEAETHTTLEYGVPRNGSVAVSRSAFFQVAGADEIQLTTISGDADLYIYSDSGFTDRICASENAASFDSCEIGTIDTVYIDVFGYEASSYSIVAVQDSTEFQVGQSETYSITANDQQHFTVSGANFIQTDSISGDVDLYVYSSAARDASVLQCNSRNSSDFSTTDFCEINTGTVYISVFGVQAGQYTVAAFDTDPRVAQVTVDNSEEATPDPLEPILVVQSLDDDNVPVVNPESGNDTSAVLNAQSDALNIGGGSFGVFLFAGKVCCDFCLLHFAAGL